MLINTNRRGTKASIFGHKVSANIGFAPIGINKIYNPRGEFPVAKVAKELNLPYCLSTAGSNPIGNVGAANGEGPRFFQLYIPHDDELTISLLTRAYKSSFSVCILDSWRLAWRQHDEAESNYAFYMALVRILDCRTRYSRGD
jgi:isopentenyl diphosphate isomerase/L-lactate dehydrogenase-like FMN-dependent dehydrogenase